MKVISILKAKKILGLTLALCLTTSSWLEAKSSVAIPVGPPVLVSPIPGPANPDPILQNLVTYLNNFFQQPWYSSGFPNFPPPALGQVLLFDPALQDMESMQLILWTIDM